LTEEWLDGDECDIAHLTASSLGLLTGIFLADGLVLVNANLMEPGGLRSHLDEIVLDGDPPKDFAVPAGIKFEGPIPYEVVQVPGGLLEDDGSEDGGLAG